MSTLHLQVELQKPYQSLKPAPIERRLGRGLMATSTTSSKSVTLDLQGPHFLFVKGGLGGFGKFFECSRSGWPSASSNTCCRHCGTMALNGRTP